MKFYFWKLIYQIHFSTLIFSKIQGFNRSIFRTPKVDYTCWLLLINKQVMLWFHLGIHVFIHSPFNGSGGFCTTMRIKSSSGATKISCFLLLILRYVSSLAGSKSLTIDLALSDSCDINTEYWNVSMNVRYMTLKCITLEIRRSGSIFVYEMRNKCCQL